MAALAPRKPAPLPQGYLTNGVGPSLGSMNNTLAPPVAPPQIQAPNLPTSPTAPAFGFTAPTVGAAPTATPTAAFQAPDPTKMSSDPYYQFRQAQMQKGLERGAASRGTLLSGNFQSALADRVGLLASAEGDKIHDRALTDYTTNRDTNQANFGQSLASYNAGTGAALDAGRLNLAGTTSAYDRTYGAQRDTFNDQRDAATTQANVLNVNNQAAAAHQQQMAEYNAQLAAQQQAAAMEAQRQQQGAMPPMGAAPVRSGPIGGFGPSLWDRNNRNTPQPPLGYMPPASEFEQPVRRPMRGRR